MSIHMNVDKIKGLFTWNTLFIAIFLFGYGFYLVMTPRSVDDYWFTDNLREWFVANGAAYPDDGVNLFQSGIPLDRIFDTISYHYADDNIRFPNIIATFLLLLPKWVGSSLIAFLFGWSVFIAFRLAGVDWRKSWLVPFALLAWTLCLPWHDRLYSFDYQINYFLPLWLGLMLISSLRRVVDGCARRWWLPLIWAFFLGISHEGLASPILVGLAVQAIVFRKWRDKSVIISVVLIALGIMLLMSSPGMVRRVGFDVDENYQKLFALWWLKEVFLWRSQSFLLFVAVSVLIIMKRGWAGFKSSQLVLFWMVSSSAAVTLMLVIDAPRVLIWSEFVSVLAVMRLLCDNFRSCCGGYNKWTALAGLLVVTLLSLHVVELVKLTMRCRQSARESYESYVKNNGGNMFADPCDPAHAHPLAFGLPGMKFSKDCNTLFMRYFGRIDNRSTDISPKILPPDMRSTTMIPRDLEYVTRGSGRDVSCGDGIREVNGYYFAPFPESNRPFRYSIWESVQTRLTVDFGKGPREIIVLGHQFRSKGDGREYLWLPLEFNWYMTHFKTLREVRFIATETGSWYKAMGINCSSMER